jgi:Concanavalin A-like lectin/glucanases superfamily
MTANHQIRRRLFMATFVRRGRPARTGLSPNTAHNNRRGIDMRRIALKAALSAAVIAALAVAVGGAVAAPSPYETAVKANNPLVYYRMAETELPTITTLRDASGREKHGSYTTYLITQGQPSAIATDAADFSVTSGGGDVLASVLAPDLPAGDAARTVEAWYKSPPSPFTPTRQALVAWGSGGSGMAFGMHVDGDKLWVDAWGTQGYFVSGTGNIQDGEWHHLAITYDPAASPRYAGYVDGTRLALALPDPGSSPLDPNAPLSTDGAAPLTLGGVFGTLILNGSLDEVAVYGSALSADTLKGHHDTAAGAGCTGAQPADNEAASCVTANVVSQFAVRLDPATIDFGNVVSGSTYSQLQHISVEKNDAQGGYQLSVSRTAFSPSDLSLGITCAGANQNGTRVCSAPLSTTPGGLVWDLLVDSTSPIAKAPEPATPIAHRTTGATGAGDLADKWPTALVLQVPSGTVAGRYSAVVTYSAVVLP